MGRGAPGSAIAMARVVVAPLILLSLSATAVVSVPLFLGLIVQCFPSLL